MATDQAVEESYGILRFRNMENFLTGNQRDPNMSKFLFHMEQQGYECIAAIQSSFWEQM